MAISENICSEMISLYDECQALHLSRFFKTGKGEYGEGDRFLGIKVPVTRSIVKKYRNIVTLADLPQLISSEWHEIRLAGFLLLSEIYKKAVKEEDENNTARTVAFYLTNIDKGNNWDLVDIVSYNILGDRILRKPEEINQLYDLADHHGQIWHQRVAIVSTFALIKSGIFNPTFQIVEKLLFHPHDLIHKASGWMLREIGKRGGKDQLIEFLNKHRLSMPRTMLRYAIEKFPENERRHFMAK